MDRVALARRARRAAWRIAAQAQVAAASGLAERERTILELRLGMRGGCRHTQREVGVLLGISTARVAQIEGGLWRRLGLQESREAATKGGA